MITEWPFTRVSVTPKRVSTGKGIYIYFFIFQNSINIYNIKQALHNSATEIGEY